MEFGGDPLANLNCDLPFDLNSTLASHFNCVLYFVYPLYDMYIGRIGEWSTAGCSVIERFNIDDGAYVKCSCSHMTSYALIMDVSDQEVGFWKWRSKVLLWRPYFYSLKAIFLFTHLSISNWKITFWTLNYWNMTSFLVLQI